MVKERLVSLIEEALKAARARGAIQSGSDPRIVIEIPKREGHGDYATGVAMALAQTEGRPPRAIAELLLKHMKNEPAFLSHVEIAGPGYINFTLAPAWWQEILIRIEQDGGRYGRTEEGRGRRVQVEFVSANPTGPLHVGHGRWAAVGNAVVNILRASGYDAEREYYINDAGRQVKLLGRSVIARYRQKVGNPVRDPEDGYRGEYVGLLADRMIDRFGNQYKEAEPDSCLDVFTQTSQEEMIGLIRKDLEAFGIHFDSWFNETELFETGAVDKVLEEIRKKDLIYEKDGAHWFRSTKFGDDKDRVVRKEDGEYTYLASDMAYHKNKLGRGFDFLINIWGADHHGYTARMEAVVQALGYPKSKLRILIGQLVTLLRDGQPVPMSKRSGEFITLRDVIDEVGRDAALFFFLMRRFDTHLEFDLELAKRQSNENPVYYVQYAHARLCSVFRQAVDQGLAKIDPGTVRLALLSEPEELKLMKHLGSYPELVRDCARSLEPHPVVFYLLELAGMLHQYYFKHRIISADQDLTQARLLLAGAVRQVMANALEILGVSAPERM